VVRSGQDSQAPLGSGALVQPTFVGRDAELRQLEAAFESAAAGAGAIVAVLGEPGIGKSSLCDQIVNYVKGRGGRTLVGHCYEDGSLSLPYLPYIQALTGYARERRVDDLREELGPGIGDVARIVSAIRERIPIEMPVPDDPERDRWRLQQAVTDFIRRASSAEPMLIVLEDLHDADRATLDLLIHQSRQLEGMRLLVLVTYRHVQVNRGHPLSASLAELRRSARFYRLLLHGLTIDEVHRLLRLSGLGQAAGSLAEAIQHQTEGNPLFVQEVARYLAEEGLAREHAGLSSTAQAAALRSIPEGLRDVIGKRLSRLEVTTNQLLSVAAVIGREFRLDVLQQLVELPEREFDGALQQATAAGIIEEYRSVGAWVTYRFSHALFRQTLYEELIAPRRIRLHQQVARALDAAYSARVEEHAAELAEHFAFSSEPLDLARAVSYGQLAARQAMSVYVYAEAVRLLERALAVQAELDPQAAIVRCDLLLAVGEALLPTGEAFRVKDAVAAEAFALAEAQHDETRAARASMQALHALYVVGQVVGNEFGEWARRADKYAAVGTPERIYADCWMGLYSLGSGKIIEGHAYLRRAVGRSRELKDDAMSAEADRFAMSFLLSLRDLEFNERLAAEFQNKSHTGIRTEVLATSLSAAGALLLGRGDRDAAEQAWLELVQLSARVGDQTVSVMSTACMATLAFIDGRIEDASELWQSVQAFSDAVGVGSHYRVRGDGARRPEFYLGRLSEADLANLGPQNLRTFVVARALVLAYLNRCDEAYAVRELFGDVGADEDESALHALCGLLEVSILCGDTATAEALLRRLSSLAGRLQPYYTIVSFGRLLGEAAAMLRRPEEARSYFRQALEVCQRVRFRPEIALLHLDLAQLSSGSSRERAEAVDHLRFAISEFAEMHMQPSLDRANVLLERLVSVDAAPLTTAADPLTARERDVAGLIGNGHSNREIAASLVITEATVEVHVKHILDKLGFRSRSQVAVWAVEHKLTKPH
jgi:predicted ATPase/DNA-binding CsgD family transcriptional regulator